MSNDQNYSSKNIKQHFEDLEFWSFDVFFPRGSVGGEGRGCYLLGSFIFISITLKIFEITKILGKKISNDQNTSKTFKIAKIPVNL